MSHSKRNTTRPVFTSYERDLAKASWGSSTARLSRESFLPFASCGLCLEPAIDPVACVHGDIFCRECALSNILAQKKEIKRAEKAREQEEREALEEQTRRDLEAQERAVREFELTQAGLASQNGIKKDMPAAETASRADEAKRGEKRKFSLDEDELARIAAEERTKARKAIDEEKASKPALPSFWSPAVTPSLKKDNILYEVKKKVKTQPTCPVASENKPHFYSLYSLVSINFTEEKDSTTKSSQRICPSCKKVLSNASKAMLAKPCGHVLCKSCVDKFMKPLDHDPHSPDAEANTIRCYVCDADLTNKPSKKDGKAEKEKIKPGLVELRREGTGFSAGGSSEVKRDHVSFRC